MNFCSRFIGISDSNRHTYRQTENQLTGQFIMLIPREWNFLPAYPLQYNFQSFITFESPQALECSLFFRNTRSIMIFRFCTFWVCSVFSIFKKYAKVRRPKLNVKNSYKKVSEFIIIKFLNFCKIYLLLFFHYLLYAIDVK